MSILDHLRGLFRRSDMPDEVRRAFERARTPRDLLRELDRVLTENEVEYKDLERELERLEEKERLESAKIREGAVEGRQKRSTLLSIQRLRRQMDNLESRLRIYDRNMSLHQNLIGKIQEMEAMRLRGIDEKAIDKIVMEFEEQLEKYEETMSAGELAETAERTTAREERELAEIEREILGKPVPSKVETRREALAVEAVPEKAPAVEKAPPAAGAKPLEGEAPAPEVEKKKEIELE
jgi:hypothetical protein